MSFGVTPGPKIVQSEKSGGRGGTQLIDFKNKALVTCTSILCFRSATGASTGSLVGRPSTRGRIYVAFGEHPAAGGLYVFFGTLGSYPMKKILIWAASWCLFSIVHDLEAPLWHPRRHFRNLEHMVVSFWYFGGPRGSSLATLGPYCATLDVHFDDFLTLWDMS